VTSRPTSPGILGRVRAAYLRRKALNDWRRATELARLSRVPRHLLPTQIREASEVWGSDFALEVALAMMPHRGGRLRKGVRDTWYFLLFFPRRLWGFGISRYALICTSLLAVVGAVFLLKSALYSVVPVPLAPPTPLGRSGIDVLRPDLPEHLRWPGWRP
jgi:hypothetical protein